MPMRAENDFLIDFSQIPEKVARAAKLMIVSYPNNPTGAVAPLYWYKELVAFASRYDIVVVHDNAYCELVFEGALGFSFLSVPGAKEVGVEFNSLSKTYAMPGARVGFCVGNEQIVGAVKRLKSNIDYGIFLPIQRAAIAAMTGDQAVVAHNRQAYRERRDAFIQGAKDIGWNIQQPKGSMFVWAPLPAGWQDEIAFCEALMERAQTILVPGGSFGPSGKGYVRIALVQSIERIRLALARIAESGMVRA
jgi:LL-diaminopimelate aminotransferase